MYVYAFRSNVNKRILSLNKEWYYLEITMKWYNEAYEDKHYPLFGVGSAVGYLALR